MLPLRDAVSMFPHITLTAVEAVAKNSTSTTTKDAFRNTIDGSTTVSSLNDATAGFLFSLLEPYSNNTATTARTLHKVLVASNLFWYQTIRQTVAVLSVFMCQEFEGAMDTAQQAQLIAAPSVGNVWTQAFGGLIISWLPGGTKSAITIALMGLAIGCILLPLAIPGTKTSTSGSFSLRKAFALLSIQGLLFGPMFPAHSVLLSKWLPPNERGSAMAYGEIAMSIASMGVPIVVTSIVKYTTKPFAMAPAEEKISEASSTAFTGWRNGFYATGVICFGYLIAWIVLGRKDPESCSYISREELNLIRSVQSKSDRTKQTNRLDVLSDKTNVSNNSLSWQKILLHPSILSLFFVHMVYNFVTLSINSWMPTYYNDVLKLNPNESKPHIVLPQLIALLVKVCISAFARILRKNIRNEKIGSKSRSRRDERSVILFSRRFISYLGFIVMAIPMSLLPLVAPPLAKKNSIISMPKKLFWSSPWWSTGLFSIALAGTGFHAESFRANYLDVTNKYVGLVSGVGNCLSSISAMFAPFIVGGILRKTSGDWSPVWVLSALASIVAAVVFGVFSTTIPVEEEAETTVFKD